MECYNRARDDGSGQACWATYAQIVEVIDGDTVTVEAPCSSDDDCWYRTTCVDGRCSPDPPIRLLAINAGEIPHRGGENEDHHCLGDEAQETLERLVDDREVRLVYEPVAGCYGRWGRLLAYVWADDVLAQTHVEGHLGQGRREGDQSRPTVSVRCGRLATAERTGEHTDAKEWNDPHGFGPTPKRPAWLRRPAGFRRV